MSNLTTTIEELRQARQHVANALKNEDLLGPKAIKGLREASSTFSAIITYPKLEIDDV